MTKYRAIYNKELDKIIVQRRSLGFWLTVYQTTNKKVFKGSGVITIPFTFDTMERAENYISEQKD